MAIELPKDAEGREIPLDTSKLFISDGTMVHVLRFEYMYHTSDAHDDWFVYIERTPGEHMTVHACDAYLTPLDSLKKLLEDLDRCIKADSLCAYRKSEECSTCVLPRDSQCHCKSLALKDIKERIRNLGGVS